MGEVSRIVILGGGIAAAKAAAKLRSLGWDGHLTVITREAHPPYERPPLSKGLLLDRTTPPSTAYVAPEDWYVEHAVELVTETEATHLDVAGSSVWTRDGALPFDRLLLATGARPRRLPESVVRGELGASVTYLRTIEESLQIRSRLAEGVCVVLVGGGWICMEVAAAARTAGCEVVLLARDDLPLQRGLGRAVAQRLTDVHRAHGVKIRTRAVVAEVSGDDQRGIVVLADGEQLAADLVVVGIGAEPAVELASQAGLTISDGIDADRFLRTAAHHVFVAGDAGNPYNPRYQRHVRGEHWADALHQGELAAANMVGDQAPYDRVPYFFTDQFEIGLELTGRLEPGLSYETVVRGDVDDDAFVVFWLREGRVAAGLHVNSWDSMASLTRLVQQRHAVQDVHELTDADLGDAGTGG